MIDYKNLPLTGLFRLQFVLGYGVVSRAIAYGSAGHFSHVDAVLPSGSLYGARSDRIVTPQGVVIEPGVQVRPPFYEKWKERVVMAIPITPDQERALWWFEAQQEGKRYDQSAIFAFFTGRVRDWREDDSWFCSELQTAAPEFSGVFPTIYTPASKVTPACLATIMSAKSARVVSYSPGIAGVQ